MSGYAKEISEKTDYIELLQKEIEAHKQTLRQYQQPEDIIKSKISYSHTSGDLNNFKKMITEQSTNSKMGKQCTHTTYMPLEKSSINEFSNNNFKIIPSESNIGSNNYHNSNTLYNLRSNTINT